MGATGYAGTVHFSSDDAQALYANPSPLIGAAIVYLLFLWPMVRLVGYLEKRSKTAAH